MTNPSTFWNPTSGTDLLWLFITILIAAAVLLTLAISLYLLLTLQKLLEPQVVAQPVVPKESFWKRFIGLHSLEQEHTLAMEHTYDNIVELDNPPPPWFMALFYGTIAFGLVYLGIYHVFGTGDVMAQEYTQEVAIANQQREAYIKLVAGKINENTVTQLADSKGIAAGQALFTTYCTACHGTKGEGIVGPNLTDDFWLHGGTIKAVYHTINEGVPEKGMVSWKKQLNPLQVQQVASFILSIKGTNPPNGKAPQGEKMAMQ
ncbi:c-type cytochrome [Fibrella sp. HMF5335]|uniref:C-type cytochrome n=1 Tax=Fibrella rubiginis TaxID=2817060 RepID=A0A939GF78_9BACT|nr:cbb3-type cytochrome c oxidase N-terminal domain-containing protein [Fibrella rubiginis]MBO0935432.1 c-type cytochrome [Fibrella rubiginis]